MPAPRLPILRSLALAALCGCLCAPVAGQEQPAGEPQPGAADRAPGSQPESPPPPPPTLAEPHPAEQFEGRPIYEVVIRRPGERPGEFVPLQPRREELARNQIGSRAGAPLNPQVVTDDLQKLNRLGEFGEIEASIEQVEGGWVRLVYTVTPQPKILAVGFSGNKEISNQELYEVAGRRLEGAPVNDEAIEQAVRDLEAHYQSEGYGLAEVTAATDDLEDTGTLHFIIVEGLRVRITAVRFVGNSVISSRELRSAVRGEFGRRVRVVRTRPRDMFGLLEKGRLDPQMVAADEVSIARYYKDRGYLDARVGSRLVYAPNGREVIVEFLITEGPRYTVRNISVLFDGIEGDAARFSEEQIRGLIPLKTGEVYSETALQESVNAVYAAYVELGYVECNVRSIWRSDREGALVDIELQVSEGRRYRTGAVLIQGNDFTRMEVILRDVLLRPGRWLSGHVNHDRRPVAGSDQAETQRRLEQSRLFGPVYGPDVRVTIQPPDPVEPQYRDVLIEVEEMDTGEVNIGAAVSSDLGVVGRINIVQRNFDITDTPDSLSELLAMRAFRGAGQRAELTLQPGATYQEYAARFTEPHMFETDYSFSVGASYWARQFRDYDEVRYGGEAGVGRQFGTRWSGSLQLRGQQVGIFSIDEDGPVDFFDVEGYNSLFGIGAELGRTTLDDRFRPSRGTQVSLRAEQVFSNDEMFTKLRARHLVYITLYEDAVGSRTTLSLRTQADWIPQDQEDVPFYERYSQGGAGFRGFGVRGIGPVGIRNDTGLPGSDQVGGVWSFFWGAELQQPLTQNLALALFADTGTVEDSVTFDHYRLSVGTGLRLFIPQLSPAPLALDFGFPIIKEDSDDTRIFTFSVDIPF